MISESLYFEFNGEESTNYGIMNVHVSTGLFNETFLSGRSITEHSVRGRHKPYFQEVSRSPKTINLTFYLSEGWDEYHIKAVSRWLNVNHYKPLIFSAQPEIVYYAMPVDESTLAHNGLRQGYITISMRTDSPYSYGKEMTTGWIDATESDTTEIVIDNLGDDTIIPDIEIEKVGDGDISISHIYEESDGFIITGLKDSEVITIDGENRLIETSLPGVYRYANSNKQYLKLPFGKCQLLVSGKCYIKFDYRYSFFI